MGANLAEMYTVWCFSQLCMDLLRDLIASRELRMTLSRVTMQGVHVFLVVGTTQVLCQLWVHYLRFHDKYVSAPPGPTNISLALAADLEHESGSSCSAVWM